MLSDEWQIGVSASRMKSYLICCNVCFATSVPSAIRGLPLRLCGASSLFARYPSERHQQTGLTLHQSECVRLPDLSREVCQVQHRRTARAVQRWELETPAKSRYPLVHRR